MSTSELLLHPQVWPFSLALVLFFTAALVEILLVFGGMGSDYGMDLSVDVDLPDISAKIQFLDWLGLGRVPFLISLAALLLAVGLIGLLVQGLTLETFGFAFPWPMTLVGASAASIPPVRLLNHALGRIWPRDESSAVAISSIVGREASVIMGTVTATQPGQIRFRDASGHTHRAMAYADQAEASHPTGEQLLIVGRRGGFYTVIRHPNPSETSEPLS